MRRAPGLWATGIALAATAAMSLWAAPRVGQRLPVHWNFAGEVDRYGSRFEGLVLLPLLTLGMGVLLAVLPRFEPRRTHIEQSARAYNAVWIVTMATLTLVHAAALFTALGEDVPVAPLVLGAIGLLLLVTGNYLGKVRSNFFLGIRTPWTLSSEHVWNRTHRVGGRLFAGVGLLVLATLPLSHVVSAWVLAVGLGAITLGLAAYSYVLWRQDPTGEGAAR